MTVVDRAEPLLPLGLRLAGRRVVVVGGGPVALRRVGALLSAHALVTVVSPEVVAALQDLAERGHLDWQRRVYAEGDLAGAWLAMACTADADVNAAVVREADAQRTFCLRVDDARTASAWMPATGRSGRATVSVHGDRDPRRAAALRDAAVTAVEAVLRDERDGAGRRAAGTGGRVVLVGGGPGDPELLTLRGFQALAEADVVVVDRLAPLAVLDGLREGVEIIDVSKIPRGRSTPQEEINAVVVDRARRGCVVVRLKGGDSYVFGRGMEEVLACREAGVPVTVVPGVTSAVAAPELAGIPVTHRGVAHDFTVLSGHLPPEHAGSLVDWEAVARLTGTLLLMMAVENAPAIASALVEGGRAAGTPVAVVCDGSMAAERTVFATLGTLGEALEANAVRAPAIIVVGEVVRVAHPEAY